MSQPSSGGLTTADLANLRSCVGCGRWGFYRRMRTHRMGWSHVPCVNSPPTFPAQVLCVVCGKVDRENNMLCRKSGWKCARCVGKPHSTHLNVNLPLGPPGSGVTTATASSPGASSPEGRPTDRGSIAAESFENKDSKNVPAQNGRPNSGYPGEAVAGRSTTSSSENFTIVCVSCGRYLSVPTAQTLIQCSRCLVMMNPRAPTMRYIYCNAPSCNTLLQFPVTQVSPGSLIACGNCRNTTPVPAGLAHTVGRPMVVASGRPVPVGHSPGGGAGYSKKLGSPAYALQLPVRNYEKKNGKEVECSFCLENFEDGDSVKTLPCFHYFHSDEIDQWLYDHTDCPLCKTSVFISSSPSSLLLLLLEIKREESPLNLPFLFLLLPSPPPPSSSSSSSSSSSPPPPPPTPPSSSSSSSSPPPSSSSS
eukprot:g25184.t1